MNTQNTHAQNSEQTQPQAQSLADLHRSFADICFQYGALANNLGVNEDSRISRFKWLAQDANKLADVAMQIHNALGGVK